MTMEKFDPARERRVWQRVNAQQPQREDLRPLVLLAQEAAGDFRFLAGQLKGPAAEQAKRLYEGAQETVACLKGMELLRSGANRRQQPLPQSQGNVRRVLERSYHRARKLAGEYTARSGDSECGMVFMALAQREQDNAMRLAALLGKL